MKRWITGWLKKQLFFTAAKVRRLTGESLEEAGAGLVEILVALAIVTSALVIFIAALSTGAFAVRASGQLTTATNLAALQLETIKAASYVTGTTAYPSIPAGGYTISQEIRYWDWGGDPGSSSFTSDPGADDGMQWITVTVSFDGDILTMASNYKVNR